MNFGTPVPLLIGLILILGGIALFFLEKIKPGYARSSDKVYGSLLLISGIFLLGHLEMPLLSSFQQLIMAGMLVTLIVEKIQNRASDERPLRPSEGPLPRRRPEERPTGRRYRAELDDWEYRQERDRRPPARSSLDGYRGSDYGGNAYSDPDDRYRPRPPYEEPRRPAGRLQPSDGDRMRLPSDRMGAELVRPNQMNGANRSNSDRMDSPRRPDDQGWSPQQPPLPRRSTDEESRRPPIQEPPINRDGSGARNTPRRPSGRQDRSLNVKPYEERPIDPNEGGEDSYPTGGGYVDFRPVNPADASPDQPY